MKKRVDTLGLVGAREIGEMFGVTRIRANQIKNEAGDFPGPVYDDGYTVLWKRDDVHAWGLANNYLKEF